MNLSMIWSNKSHFTGCDNTVGFPKSDHNCANPSPVCNSDLEKEMERVLSDD